MLYASFTRYVSLYLRNQRLPPFKAEAFADRTFIQNKKRFRFSDYLGDVASEVTAPIAASYDSLFRAKRRRSHLLFSRTRPVLNHHPSIFLFCCLRPGLYARHNRVFSPLVFETCYIAVCAFWQAICPKSVRHPCAVRGSSCLTCFSIHGLTVFFTEKKLRTFQFQESPQFFCFINRSLMRVSKCGGPVTLIIGPKDSTRITSSVSSSLS